MPGDTSPDTSMQDARIKIASLFSDDLEIPADKVREAAPAASDAGEDDDEAATLAAAEALAASEAQSEGEASDDAGEDSSEATPPAKRKLKVGEDELDEDEVVKGYLRQSDYTKKTQALAEERKKLEQEELPKVRTLIEQYAQQLKVLETAVREQSPAEPDWVKLRGEVTADEFAARWAEWQQHERQLTKLAEKRKEAETAVAAERERVAAERAKAGYERLLELIPDWKDKAKGTAERQQILEYVEPLGITKAQLAQVDMPELFVVLRDAAAYAQLKKQGKTLVAQGSKAADVPVLRPGGAKSAKPAPSQAQKAIQKAAKTGRVEDAAAAMRQLGID